MDHVSYVRQAFDRAPFDYLLEVVGSRTFIESDVSLLFLFSFLSFGANQRIF
jgi:hypothetical protein